MLTFQYQEGQEGQRSHPPCAQLPGQCSLQLQPSIMQNSSNNKNKTNYEEYYSVYTIPEAAKCMTKQLAVLEQARSSFYGQEIKS